MFFTKLIEILLVLWIAKTVFGWYSRTIAAKNGNTPEQFVRTEPKPVHNGAIEDAEFEEIDGGNNQSR